VTQDLVDCVAQPRLFQMATTTITAVPREFGYHRHVLYTRGQWLTPKLILAYTSLSHLSFGFCAPGIAGRFCFLAREIPWFDKVKLNEPVRWQVSGHSGVRAYGW